MTKASEIHVINVLLESRDIEKAATQLEKLIEKGDQFYITEGNNQVAIQIVSNNAKKIAAAMEKLAIEVVVSNASSTEVSSILPASNILVAKLEKKGAKLAGAAASGDSDPKKQIERKAANPVSKQTAKQSKRKTKTQGSSSKNPEESSGFLCNETRREIARGENSMEFIDYPILDIEEDHAFTNLMDEIYQEFSDSSLSALFIDDYDVTPDIPANAGNCDSPCVPMYVLELGASSQTELGKADVPAPAGVSISGAVIKQMTVSWVLWEYCVREDDLPEPHPDGVKTGGSHTVHLGGGQNTEVRCKNFSNGDVSESEIIITRMGAIGFDREPYITRAKKRAINRALFEASHFGVQFLEKCEVNCPERTVITHFGPIHGGMELAGYN